MILQQHQSSSLLMLLKTCPRLGKAGYVRCDAELPPVPRDEGISVVLLSRGWEPKIRLGWDSPAAGLLKAREGVRAGTLSLLADVAGGAENKEADVCCDLSSGMGAFGVPPFTVLLSSANVLSRLRAW